MIYACFSANSTLFDLLQRGIVARSPYPLPAPYPLPLATHTWLEKRDGDYWRGREFVPPISREFDPREKEGQLVRRYHLLVDEDTEDIIWRAASRDLHRPYDVVGLVVVGYFALSGQQDRFFDSHHASLFCSEAETTWLRSGGVMVLPNLPADNVFPALLESYISSIYPRVEEAQWLRETPTRPLSALPAATLSGRGSRWTMRASPTSPSPPRKVNNWRLINF